MKAQRWGRIVNLIGGAGKEPDPYMFGSGMTNSALLNLTKSLSTEFGEDNVLVNAICPGWVDTNLWKRNAEGLKQELGVKSEDEARKLAAKKNSLGRMGKPEELANARATSPASRSTWTAGGSRACGRRKQQRRGATETASPALEAEQRLRDFGDRHCGLTCI
jgi:3-oxoacyl-[acyl-carrier protein] reductase